MTPSTVTLGMEHATGTPPPPLQAACLRLLDGTDAGDEPFAAGKGVHLLYVVWDCRVWGH